MKKSFGGLSSDKLEILQWKARELFEYSQFIRRDIHHHPELGFQEIRTAGIIARELVQMGLEVSTGIAETGVVALLEGANPGPVVLMRFDMDALPIQEETSTLYASANSGVMHACGHDGHVAVGLTVARILMEARESLNGTIKFVFQPAEEGLGGAERMIECGVLENPQVDTTLSMHLWNEFPVGWLAISPGPLMAGADIFSVRLEGRGGHGALPHESRDPVTAAAQIITALQTVVSRNVSPLDTAVISVGKLNAGDAFNVIPQWAEFTGTFRTFTPEVRRVVVNRFEAIVNGIAEAMGCEAKIQLDRLTPPVINDSVVTKAVESFVREIVPDASLTTDYRTMVSEDMAYMMEKVAGCYLMVGSGFADASSRFGHHHPKFDIDENALPQAAAVMAAAAFAALELKRNNEPELSE